MAANPEPKPIVAPKGSALMKARRRPRAPRVQLGTPPRANGAPINGASTSTTRIGY